MYIFGCLFKILATSVVPDLGVPITKIGLEFFPIFDIHALPFSPICFQSIQRLIFSGYSPARVLYKEVIF